MVTSITKIKFPELFFGFVAPIGADFSPAVGAFRSYLEAHKYDVIEIKVTDVFQLLEKYIPPERPLKRTPLQDRYQTHIDYGNQLRKIFGNAVLAQTVINRIIRRRTRVNRTQEEKYSKVAFLIHQFKRKEEVDLLRSVYGRLFMQISVYSRRGARVDYLSRRFADSRNSAMAQQFRAEAESLIQRDENEMDVPHGQTVGKIFHDADFIVSLDSETETPEAQVRRFCELIFGSNSISPTRAEYGMFLARAAALRTLDLSRPVGAAIFSSDGEIVCLGSNEVPKANGGTYWPEDRFDDREYKRGIDSNNERKREIISEIIQILKVDRSVESVLSEQSMRDSQFMDALEYGRIIHAEMSAICDAARLGKSVKGATLFTTTFPCHMCAKHIVAAGIDKVVFLEPYPKSLASEFHSDSLEIEGGDRGKYQHFPFVKFTHFYGVTPRRFAGFFERGRRKNEKGIFLSYVDGEAAPMMNIYAPFYHMLEQICLEETSNILSFASDEEGQAGTQGSSRKRRARKPSGSKPSSSS